MWTPYPPYHDEVYEPVWATCAELRMPVHVHSGNADKASYGTYVGMYVTEVRWWSTRPLHFLLWAGVFERHPDLRFVATECGAFWAADLLWMMDTAYDREHGAKKLGEQLTAHLSMRPSAYFDRNCSIGASNTRRRELVASLRDRCRQHHVGQRLPHPEGTWPRTRAWLRDAFHDIPADETAAMLGLNAADLYGFDVDALRPLADRIGPSTEELGQASSTDLAKWDELRAAGRPWITGVEATPIALG